MMPQRVQRRRAKGWRMPENTVYVGRGSYWGNPFQVGKHGTQAECVELFKYACGGYYCITKTVDVYQEARRIGQSIARGELRELRGKNLACWCAPGKPCHADILLELANGLHCCACDEPQKNCCTGNKAT